MDDHTLPLTQHQSLLPLTRPAGPQQTYTSPDMRFPEFRLSQTMSNPSINGVVEITPPRSEIGAMSPKRISAEVPKPPKAHRKKSGFSSFVNSMLGSPRQIRISAPENPTHITHVCFNEATGQFTVRCTDEYFIWNDCVVYVLT